MPSSFPSTQSVDVESQVQFTQTLQVEDVERHGRKIDDFLWHVWKAFSVQILVAWDCYKEFLSGRIGGSKSSCWFAISNRRFWGDIGAFFASTALRNIIQRCSQRFLPACLPTEHKVPLQQYLFLTNLRYRADLGTFGTYRFSKQALRHGPPMLQFINPAIKDEYLPSY